MKPKGRPLVMAFPGNEALAAQLVRKLDADLGELHLHRFPDQELRVSVAPAVSGRDVVLACSLHDPNEKLVALYLTACTLREQDAERIVLVAPYLAYMRQDKSFQAGEGVSAMHIARWLSGFLDGLVTVDPHLHRIHALGDAYRIPTRCVHAAPAMTAWIRQHVSAPLLVGPDGESAQWVADVARDIPCPFLILEKHRHGDFSVEVEGADGAGDRRRTPVLVDDIISSGRTLIAATQGLLRAGYPAPVCVGVHALFVADAYEQLRKAGVAQVVTCNTVGHASNVINLHGALADSLRELLDHTRSQPRGAPDWSL